jgi:hypothetical protein
MMDTPLASSSKPLTFTPFDFVETPFTKRLLRDASSDASVPFTPLYDLGDIIMNTPLSKIHTPISSSYSTFDCVTRLEGPVGADPEGPDGSKRPECDAPKKRHRPSSHRQKRPYNREKYLETMRRRRELRAKGLPIPCDADGGKYYRPRNGTKRPYRRSGKYVGFRGTTPRKFKDTAPLYKTEEPVWQCKKVWSMDPVERAIKVHPI